MPNNKMVENGGLENKVEEVLERDFIERVFDASGAAIGTSFLTKALITGYGYAAIMAYLIPYGAFKAVKYAYNTIKNPFKSLSLKGISEAAYDLFSNILPYKEKVPASVGIISAGVNYAGKSLASYS